MNGSEHWHTASDGKKLFFRRFLPEGPPRAVVHVAHGVCEHSARYQPLAEALTGEGYAVYANDHRGHGRTAVNPEELGFFEGGVGRVVLDLVELIAIEKGAHPGLPLVFFGHSMGSLLGQELLISHGSALDAVVLSGSTGKPNALAAAGRVIARVARWRQGPRGKSALIRKLAFDAFNKPFVASGPTRFEWLSRDRAEVDRYVADPLCGFDASNALWVEVLDLLREIARPHRQAAIPKGLSVYVFSGSEDPANERTQGLVQLLQALRAAGLTDVTHRFYPGGRHEMLNETNRAEVHSDLLRWLDDRVRRPAAQAAPPASG